MRTIEMTVRSVTGRVDVRSGESSAPEWITVSVEACSARDDTIQFILGTRNPPAVGDRITVTIEETQ